jgi:hypothetical protein
MAIKVKETKIIETKIEGADPYQPVEFMDITKDLVGYRLRFVWPKPKKIVKKWYQFWL